MQDASGRLDPTGIPVAFALTPATAGRHVVLVNYTTRELTAKLVYYGPGLCGKTTNLQYIYETLLPPDRRGKMVSLATETDRTLFFDFLPLEIGKIRGLETRLQLYTVPGQVHYNATRKIVLKGADGIVFVADSQRSMKQANKESFQNMEDNLKEHGLSLAEIPHVLQFNKRDLPDVMPVEELFDDLNTFNAPFWESVAVEGVGVEDTLKSLVKLVLKNLAAKFAPGSVQEAEAAVASPPTAPPAKTAPEAVAPPAASPPAASPPAALPAAEVAAARPVSKYGEHDSPLMRNTGELLALEFDSISGAVRGGGEEDVLELADDALVDDEPPTAERAAAVSEPPTAQRPTAPAAAVEEEDPFGAGEAEAPKGHEAGDVFGFDGDEPEGQAVEAIDEPRHADMLEAPPEDSGSFDAGGETVILGAEPAPPDLEMPDLEGGPGAGDTLLSPVGDLEGLATEADLHQGARWDETPEAEAEEESLDLVDTPDLPDLPASPERAPEPAPGAVPVQPEAAVLDLPATLSLGTVEGEVERTLRLPVEWTDASGRARQRMLEVRLRFRLD